MTGRIIRRLHLERGMSQEVLSGLAAVSRAHLTEIGNANVDALWRIVDRREQSRAEEMPQIAVFG